MRSPPHVSTVSHTEQGFLPISLLHFGVMWYQHHIRSHSSHWGALDRAWPLCVCVCVYVMRRETEPSYHISPDSTSASTAPLCHCCSALSLIFSFALLSAPLYHSFLLSPLCSLFQHLSDVIFLRATCSFFFFFLLYVIRILFARSLVPYLIFSFF